MKLYQVDAGHFCAGIVVDAGRVVDAAPILKWAIGKYWGQVCSYLMNKKKYSVRHVSDS